MATSLHYFKPGQDITAVATAALTGATFVKLATGGVYNAPHIAAAGEDDIPFGVVARDAENAERVLVHTGGVVPVTAGAAVTAGALIGVGADGKAAVAADRATAVGQALADAAAGEPVSVLLSI
ncbi:capsid cement protein [Brevibacterium moorei]|uniref:capsid cement protein n=1 Tax=Brevibacterium moorei TaxID=2968457 RepID=UPI00211B7B93|nr:capsid cement protein [Brevibacterium sp. 68QC2CO]MCQ9384442.1 DUF2190 family protein [Brevibacterium sp. 68QC2CO]